MLRRGAGRCGRSCRADRASPDDARCCGARRRRRAADRAGCRRRGRASSWRSASNRSGTPRAAGRTSNPCDRRPRAGCRRACRRRDRASSPKLSACSIRCSISRMLVRYSSSLLVVAVAELAAERAGIVEHEIENRPLRLLAGLERLGCARRGALRRRAARTAAADSARAASACWPNATRRCIDTRRHSRCRNPSTCRSGSQVSSSDGNRVRWPTALGRDLVDRNAEVDVGAGRLAWPARRSAASRWPGRGRRRRRGPARHSGGRDRR